MTGEFERILQEVGREKDIDRLRQALKDVFSWHSRHEGIGYSCTRTFPGRFFKDPEEKLEGEMLDFLHGEAPDMSKSLREDLASDPDRYLVLWDLGLVNLTQNERATDVDITLEGARLLTGYECTEVITIQEHFSRMDQRRNQRGKSHPYTTPSDSS